MSRFVGPRPKGFAKKGGDVDLDVAPRDVKLTMREEAIALAHGDQALGPPKAPSFHEIVGGASTKRLPKAPSALAHKSAELQLLMTLQVSAKFAYTIISLACVIVACLAATYVYDARKNFLQNPKGDASFTDELGKTPLTFGLKLASTLLTIASLVALTAQHVFTYRLEQLQGLVLPQQGFFETRSFRAYAFEFILMTVHCPVGCYAIFTFVSTHNLYVVYDADSLTSILSLIRLKPLLLLVITYLAGFDQSRAVIVSSRAGIQIDAYVGMRLLFKKHAILFTLTLYFLIVAVLTYCIHTVEKVVCDQWVQPEAQFQQSGFFLDPGGYCFTPGMALTYWTNCFWFLFITSLTIGYGDIVPYTNLGRAGG